MQMGESEILAKVLDGEKTWTEKAWIETCAKTLAHTCSYHIQNTCVVCLLPETVYGIFPHLLMIKILFALLITHFSIVLIKSFCRY